MISFYSLVMQSENLYYRLLKHYYNNVWMTLQYINVKLLHIIASISQRDLQRNSGSKSRKHKQINMHRFIHRVQDKTM